MKSVWMLALGVLLFGPFVFAETPMNDPSVELMKIENEFIQALLRNDAEEISRFLSEDWVIVEAHGGIVSRERFLDVVKSGALKHEKMVMDQPRVRVYGNTAVITGSATTTGTYMGSGFTTHERATDVFTKMGKRWVCVFSQLTSIESPGNQTQTAETN